MSKMLAPCCFKGNISQRVRVLVGSLVLSSATRGDGRISEAEFYFQQI